MPPKRDNVKCKRIKIYEKNEFERLLKGMKIAACMFAQSHQIVDEKEVLRRLNALTINGAADGNCCSCCGVGPFETRAEQISHYKHHWHTHNLKRKLFGKPALTLGDFNAKEGDSSVSGSDSEDETAQGKNVPPSELFAAATRHCKAFFTNNAGEVFCIYRCILHHRKEELSTDGIGEAWVERCKRLAFPVFQRWAILMVSGGHFAGAIFAGDTPVVHKTHHSYVVRRGQGQAQVTRDQYSNLPRTAGANLRRQNQAKFVQHVQDILTNWTEELNGCSMILCRAVGFANQSALFGKASPLKKDDQRVRTLPFPTRNPSYKEVQRVHEVVSSVEIYESLEDFQKVLVELSTKPASKSGSDTNCERSKKAAKSSPNKAIDRAKSRERAPRALPTQVTSSEDEGPCYIDSETPPDWIKTLSEQSINGIITNSRKDLLNDLSLNECSTPECSESESKVELEKDSKKKKKNEDKPAPVKRGPPKIPGNVKKIWKHVMCKNHESLETIFENWEGLDLELACNIQDPLDGNTALHKAAIAEKPDMVIQILNVGGDPCVRNNLLQTPYAASPHHDTRIAFRVFQAQYPDKYNYAKSQIPGPITPETLDQERERKAQQKRAKRQREKEKQIEKMKTAKFLELNDADKVKSQEARCIFCGSSLPKKPFEYDVFKFCMIRCLQNHKNIRPLHKSA